MYKVLVFGQLPLRAVQVETSREVERDVGIVTACDTRGGVHEPGQVVNDVGQHWMNVAQSIELDETCLEGVKCIELCETALMRSEHDKSRHEHAIEAQELELVEQEPHDLLVVMDLKECHQYYCSI
jgi:hypothetical protein